MRDMQIWWQWLQDLQLLERFYQCCLCTILNIYLSDFITNIKVLKQAGVTSTQAMLLKSQLRWAGHVSRMEDHCLPKITLYGEHSTGHHNRGAPKKCYKDCLKKSLNACHIDHHQWSTLAADHKTWRHTITSAISSFENTRRATLVEKTTEEEELCMAMVGNPRL